MKFSYLESIYIRPISLFKVFKRNIYIYCLFRTNIN